MLYFLKKSLISLKKLVDPKHFPMRLFHHFTVLTFIINDEILLVAKCINMQNVYHK